MKVRGDFLGNGAKFVIQRGMKIGHLVILNAVQDMEDIQGQE